MSRVGGARAESAGASHGSAGGRRSGSGVAESGEFGPSFSGTGQTISGTGATRGMAPIVSGRRRGPVVALPDPIIEVDSPDRSMMSREAHSTAQSLAIRRFSRLPGDDNDDDDGTYFNSGGDVRSTRVPLTARGALESTPGTRGGEGTAQGQGQGQGQGGSSSASRRHSLLGGIQPRHPEPTDPDARRRA